MDLSPLTVLNDRYTIRRTLGEPGPFVNTYMGWDDEREEAVVIHEYLPVHLAQRRSEDEDVEPYPDGSETLFQRGLERFIEEGSLLAGIEHGHLPKEHAPFRAFGTVCRVSTHEPGSTLAAAQEKQHGGGISEKAALAVMAPVLGGLHAAHEQGLVHARISPQSLYLAKSRRALLIGFRSAHVEVARGSDRLGEVLCPGFSPIEMYTPDGQLGPWTDVYAAAATLCSMVTGERLPEATARLDRDPVPGVLDECAALSTGLRDVLLRAVAIEPKRRVASAELLQRMLEDPSAARILGREAASTALPEAQPSAAVQDEAPSLEAAASEDAAASEAALELDEAAPSAYEEEAAPPTADGEEEAALPESEPEAFEPEPSEPEAFEPEPSEPEAFEREDAERESDQALSSSKPPAESEHREDEVSRGEAPEEEFKEESMADAAPSEETAVPAAAALHGTAEEEAFSDGASEEADRLAGEGAQSAAGDRPAVPGAAEDGREGEDGRKAAARPSAAGWRIVALAVALLVVIAGVGYALLGGSSEASGAEPYESLRAEGDSLFQQAHYEAARVRYAKALRVQPEGAPADAQLEQRLGRIDQLQATMRETKYEEQIRRAQAVEARAEEARAAGDDKGAMELFSRANEAYLSALDNRPGDSLAFARAQYMNDVLQEGTAAAEEAEGEAATTAEAAAETLPDQLYARYRQQGEEQLATENYEAARRRFEEALNYRPGDAYAQQQLDEIDARVSAAEQQRQYERYVQQGDALFNRREYIRARGEYEMAQSVQTESAVAADRIATVDSLIASEKKRGQQYQYHRAQGDVFHAQEDFEASARSYGRALELRPGDDYARERLAAARRQLEAQTAGAEKKKRLAENGGFYTVVDEQPELIGGLGALHKKVEYPQQAARAGIEGRVIVQMVVTAEGTVRNAQVLQGIGGGADDEALRVIRQARFEPAVLDGEPVPAQHSLWIQFRLED